MCPSLRDRRGGGSDTVARIISPKLHQALGQQWVIDNRGGAGGNIATEIVAKAKPGMLNYGSAGAGSPMHLAAELFKVRTGVNLVHVPYKGGGPAAAAGIRSE